MYAKHTRKHVIETQLKRIQPLILTHEKCQPAMKLKLPMTNLEVMQLKTDENKHTYISQFRAILHDNTLFMSHVDRNIEPYPVPDNTKISIHPSNPIHQLITACSTDNIHDLMHKLYNFIFIVDTKNTSAVYKALKTLEKHV